jgi:hypothetical protein
LWIEGADANGSDDNLLQKIRKYAKLAPMNKPALPHGVDRALPSRRLSTPGQRAEKKISPLQAS